VNQPLLFVAAVALVDAQGRVLLAQRPKGKDMAGLWEFPGGKIGSQETDSGAAARELREELGVEAQEAALVPLTHVLHAYERFQLFMTLFLCRTWTGEPAALEGQALAWVRAEGIDAYPMPPADITLKKALQEAICSR